MTNKRFISIFSLFIIVSSLIFSVINIHGKIEFEPINYNEVVRI